MSHNTIRNLVLEGGGVKGIAYIGVMDALQKRGVLKDLRRVAGTSAGAISAMLLALGHSVKEMSEVMWKMDFNDLADDDWGVFRDSNRFVKSFGWHKGDYFLNWAKEVVKSKTGNENCTFAQLHEMALKEPEKYKDLYVIGTNLSTRQAEIFSHETKHRDVPIATAIRISMSIPLFFAAVELNGDIYVDGGVQNNYPIRIFDKMKYTDNTQAEQNAPLFNMQTLGVRLDTEEELKKYHEGKPKRTEITNLYNYSVALIDSVLNSGVVQHYMSQDKNRTIYCNTLDISTIDFDISKINKIKLIMNGGNATAQFFNRRKEILEHSEPLDENAEAMAIVEGNIRRNLLIKYAIERCENKNPMTTEGPEIQAETFNKKAKV